MSSQDGVKGSRLPLVDCTLQGETEDDVIHAKALLDSGALGCSFVRRSIVDQLPGLKRSDKSVVGVLGNSQPWTSAESVMLPLRLVLKPLGFVNMDAYIEAFVLDDLAEDIIIGGLHISRLQLHSVSAALLDRYAESCHDAAEVPCLLSMLPLIYDSGEDDLGDLEAYPLVKVDIVNGDASYGGPDQLQQQMRSLVQDFQDIFATKVRDTPALVPPLILELDEGAKLTKALQLPVRSQCPEHNAALEEQLGDLLVVGVIREVNSQYFSQVLLVRKADGTLRFCVDYRFVNQITKAQPYPLPNIPLLLQTLAGNKYFSVVDLTAGYHQCALAEESQDLSAFKTAQGIFKFTRVPFGLKQAPGYFQRIMQDVVLKGLIGKICVVYIDDIITWGKSEAEILENTRVVFQRLRQHLLCIKLIKCKLGVTCVKFVGHMVSASGISMSDERKTAVLGMKKPSTVKELRRFLGTTNYFRRFIPNYAHVTGPLTALDRYGPKAKQHPLEWTEEADEAFQRTRQAIADAVTLSFLRDSGEIRLYPDASEYAIGAHLVQLDEEFEECTISFYSKRLNDVEQRWNVSEKEMFAVIMAVRKLHTYIGGRAFVVITDHRNLTFCLTPSASSKVERWRQLLSVYDISWRLIPGLDNVNADNLSRLLAMSVSTAEENPKSKRPRIGTTSEPSDPPQNLAQFHGDVVGHFKLDKTLEKLASLNISWPGMRKHLADFIKSCPICQKTSTAPTYSHGNTFTLKTARPNDLVAIDTVGPFDTDTYGFSYVLVLVDHMSAFVRAYPLKSTEAKECAKRMVEYMCREGTPKQLHSDRGTQFVNSVISEVTRYFKLLHTTSTAYSHEENGIVERTIRDLRNQLSAYLYEAKNAGINWSDAIPIVERILNTKVCTYTGVTPAAMRFGNCNALEVGIFAEADPQGDIVSDDYLTQIKWFQDLIMDKLPTTHERTPSADPTTFKEGDLILVERTTRLKKNVAEPLRDGPFLVLKQAGSRVSYENYQTSKVSTVHVSRCRRYQPRGDPWTELRDAMQASGTYLVEEIVSHSKIRSKYRFMVKYVGYDEPEEDFSTNMSLRKTEAFKRYVESHPELQHLLLAE